MRFLWTGSVVKVHERSYMFNKNNNKKYGHLKGRTGLVVDVHARYLDSRVVLIGTEKWLIPLRCLVKQ